MREVKSTRRRRLRLIKAEGERSEQRFHSAASALEIALEAEAARIQAEEFRQELFTECLAKPATKLRIERPGAASMTVVMDSPYLVIGSDLDCDLRLDHEDVQPRHRFLQWIDGQIYCCDLEPRFKTFPDGRQPSNGTWLNREPIAIGPFQLSLDEETHPARPDYSPLDRSPHLTIDFPQLALQFVGVEQKDNQWPVNRVLTMIGRGSQCRLRLNHVTMPHVQACLLRTKNGCWLIDVEGAGTTRVNGRVITIAAIDIGDMLQLGPFRVELITTTFEEIAIVPASGSVRGRETSAQHGSVRGQETRAQHGGRETRAQHANSAQYEIFDDIAVAPVSRAGCEAAKSSPPIKADEPAPMPLYPKSESSAGRQIKVTPPSGVKTLATPENVAAHDTARQETAAQQLVTVNQIAETSNLSLDGASIAYFIRIQLAQLALLKARLDRLKSIYDRTAGPLISPRMKEMLDKRVAETMQAHDMMRGSLAKFMKLIKHHA